MQVISISRGQEEGNDLQLPLILGCSLAFTGPDFFLELKHLWGKTLNLCVKLDLHIQ